jgi:hypothetical protein
VDLRRVYGVDLATEWRGRRWRRLLNYIDHLPANSAFTEAFANDEDAARARLESEGSHPPEHRERWSDWSPERQALARIDDRLQELLRAVISVTGGKPGQFKPAPRPRTALDELRSRRRVEHHRHIVSRLVRRHDE